MQMGPGAQIERRDRTGPVSVLLRGVASPAYFVLMWQAYWVFRSGKAGEQPCGQTTSLVRGATLHRPAVEFD